MFRKPTRLALVALLAVAAAGCSHYATVTERPPTYAAAAADGTSLAQVGQSIAAGLRDRKSDPEKALGEFLAAADEAARELARNQSGSGAEEAYNFAVVRVVGQIEHGGLAPWRQPVSVPGPDGIVRQLTCRADPQRRRSWNPAFYTFTPADRIEIGGTYLTNRVVRPGIGAPVVAVGRDRNREASAAFGMARTYYGVTAVIYFSGRRAELAFEDPLDAETIRFAGRSVPLAADFTAPTAVMLARENPKKLELSRLLRPAKYADTARLVRMQPYDPDKTVVLVVHGLKDSPATWVPLLNSLRADPRIRSRFQFWYFSYPSGYPYPYSAAILRRQLDEATHRFAVRKPMVLIGHSMGGLIARLMVTDSGERLWDAILRKPRSEVRMTETSRRILEDSLVFRRRPVVGRAIFIASPHRGSGLASNRLGRIAARLVRAPVTLLRVGDEVRRILTDQPGTGHMWRIPNSIDTLSPDNRFVRLINTIPIAPDVPYHTISGDRGKGGNRDRTLPVMSDGVVPYWSSHLAGARSERIVPSDHSAHRHPQAIDEVRRILLVHAGIAAGSRDIGEIPADRKADR